MKKKIKILQLLSPLTIAGAERVVLMLARHIDRELFDFSLCLLLNAQKLENEFVKEAEKRKIKIDKIYLKKVFEWKQVRELTKIIRKNKVDIIHAHSHRADITGYLANLFCRSKILSTIHGWTPTNRKIKIYEGIDTLLLRRFDCIITVSSEIKKRLIEKKIKASKIKVILNALDYTYLKIEKDSKSIRSEFGLNKEVKLIGTIGRLSEEKGLNYLILAAKTVCEQCKNVKFILVGEGPEKNKLIRMRNNLGLNNKVIFAGYRRDISRIYKDLDIFVLPSLSEGIPISLLEASYFKKPIIATKVGGIPELVKEKIQLIEPSNNNALSDRILYLIENRSEAEQDGLKAKDIILEKCNPYEWIKNVQQIYYKLLES